ncbi:MAG: hypothetical protein R6U58_15340 [Bacteroidales bacterium]
MIPKKVGHSIPLFVPDLPNVYTRTITFVEDNGACRRVQAYLAGSGARTS